MITSTVFIFLKIKRQQQIHHMGQILQDGENACFMSFFSKSATKSATRPDFLELIFQLILVKYEFGTPEKYSEDLENFFWVPCHGHLFTIFANF